MAKSGKQEEPVDVCGRVIGDIDSAQRLNEINDDNEIQNDRQVKYSDISDKTANDVNRGRSKLDFCQPRPCVILPRIEK